MAVAVGESHHLVLDGGTVARAGSPDAAGEHGRTVEAGGQQLVGGAIGEGDMAAHLRQAREAGGSVRRENGTGRSSPGCSSSTSKSMLARSSRGGCRS